MGMIPDLLAISRERFERDTARHELTIMHDDGLYRHLRCADPKTWSYGFDVVTWPGFLFIGGDVDDYVFAREADMLAWFESSAHSEINPPYWAQKLQGANRPNGEQFSHEAFRAQMLEWARIQLEEYGDEDEIYPSLLIGAVEREIGPYTHHEEEARDILHRLEDEGVLGETWEWSLHDWDIWFLWDCWAVMWAIKRYREVTA